MWPALIAPTFAWPPPTELELSNNCICWPSPAVISILLDAALIAASVIPLANDSVAINAGNVIVVTSLIVEANILEVNDFQLL